MENFTECLTLAEENQRIIDVPESTPEADDKLYEELQLKYNNENFKTILKSRMELPVWSHKETILKAVESNQVVIICGETGCGKTTQIGQFLLDQAIELRKGSLFHAVCTQPRRLATISLAHRIAEERIERCGELDSSIGYQIRLERRYPRRRGSILFCTAGILMQLLLSDPCLESFSHILLDEVHERDVVTDFLLAVVREILVKRPKLRVILMSATVNTEIFSSYFNNCPVLHISGKTFPIETLYLEDVLYQLDFRVRSKRLASTSNETGCEKKDLDVEYAQLMEPYIEEMQASHSYPLHVFKSLRRRESEEAPDLLILTLLKKICTREADGAVLIFLPGWENIKRFNKILMNDRLFSSRKYAIFHLHSMLPTFNQRQVFEKSPRGIRKIVLSTNIAETSLTIDDVVYVIDCGKAKQSNFDPSKKLDTLESRWITLANSRQRQGRAGRTKPGVCYKLYSRMRESTFDSFPTPEIKRVRLEEIILRLKLLKLGKVESFLKIVPEPPEERTVKISLELLCDLGALDHNEELTPLGCHLAHLPIDPRTGKLILLGAIFGCLEPMLAIAAVLSYKDPFIVVMNQEAALRNRKKMLAGDLSSDHLLMAKIMRQFRAAEKEGYSAAKSYCHQNFLSTSTMKLLSDMMDKFCLYLHESQFLDSVSVDDLTANRNSNNNELVLALLSAGLLPNVAEVVGRSPKSNVPRKSSPLSAKVKTLEDGFVLIHPRSINYDAKLTSSSWLCYFSKMRSTSIYLHDCSVVPVHSVLFFGEEMLLKQYGSKFTSEIFVSALESKKTIRMNWDSFLSRRVSKPGPTDWSADSKDSILLKEIIQFITTDFSANQPMTQATTKGAKKSSSKQTPHPCYDFVAPQRLVKR